MQPTSKKRVLILGGAGFIGSYVNKLLHSHGYETIVLDNLSRGCKEMVQQGLFIEGDIGNKALLTQLLTSHKIDAVIHFAAFIDVAESSRLPLAYYKNNVANTLTVIETMLEHKVNVLIFSSSAAVYGIPETPLIDETHPTRPINVYGETKLICEKILKECQAAHGLCYCSLRYFNAAGGDPERKIKNQKPAESNLIPILLRSFKDASSSVTLFGTDYPTPDGTCIRDYIHIHDLATAHIACMEALFDGKESAIYNLGTGKGHSVSEVIAATEKVIGKKLRVIKGTRRAGDPPYLVASAHKAQRALNWHARYSLEEIIAHAWLALQ